VEEIAEVLSIGSIVGGATPENRAWRDAIKELTARVVATRSRVEAPLNVNIVFHVPGNVVRPNFGGVRTGQFSRRDALLMVQVALPDEAPPDPIGYLRDAASAAVEEAGRWAEKRRVVSDIATLRGILERL
jgi:hypothetical protein